MDRDEGTRERIVRVAAALFLARSYNAVGIAEICTAADIRRGTLYHFFSSKSDLVKAVLDLHARAFDRQFDRAEGRSGELYAVVDAVTRIQTGIEGRFGRIVGCPMGNLAAELATADDDVRDHLAGIFERWERRMVAACHRAAEAGHLRPGVDPDRLGRTVLAQIEGLILLAKVQDRPATEISAGVHELIALHLDEKAATP